MTEPTILVPLNYPLSKYSKLTLGHAFDLADAANRDRTRPNGREWSQGYG